jgi:hypothetical protein
MGDLRVGLRARVAPSRASQTAGWGRFAPDTGRPSATGVNLTRIDTPLHAKVLSRLEGARPRVAELSRHRWRFRALSAVAARKDERLAT